MAPPRENPRSMAFIPIAFTSDYMIVFTAIMAVTFFATEVYRRDFLFAETDLTPTLASMSPGLKAGRSVIERSPLFTDAYSRSTTGYMPVIDAMKNTEKRLQSGKAAHIGHPCTRFVSAFKHMTSESLSAEKQEWAQQHIGSMTIDEFAIQLESNPELHYRSLFLPMSESLFSQDGTFLRDEVICQESTSIALSRISSQFRRPAPKELFGTPLLANPHEACQDLSVETREVIVQLYERDFCIFGYDKLPSENPSCSQARMTKEALTQRYSDCVAAEGQNQGELIVHVWNQK